jgi:hypothetical protein
MAGAGNLSVRELESLCGLLRRAIKTAMSRGPTPSGIQSSQFFYCTAFPIRLQGPRPSRVCIRSAYPQVWAVWGDPGGSDTRGMYGVGPANGVASINQHFYGLALICPPAFCDAPSHGDGQGDIQIQTIFACNCNCGWVAGLHLPLIDRLFARWSNVLDRLHCSRCCFCCSCCDDDSETVWLSRTPILSWSTAPIILRWTRTRTRTRACLLAVTFRLGIVLRFLEYFLR